MTKRSSGAQHVAGGVYSERNQGSPAGGRLASGSKRLQLGEKGCDSCHPNNIFAFQVG
jgi:hypothetical protein